MVKVKGKMKKEFQEVVVEIGELLDAFTTVSLDLDLDALGVTQKVVKVV